MWEFAAKVQPEYRNLPEPAQIWAASALLRGLGGLSGLEILNRELENGNSIYYPIQYWGNNDTISPIISASYRSHRCGGFRGY